MKAYRFPTVHPGALHKPAGALLPQKEDEEQIGTIQGRTPDSKEEWWVAKALWRLGHTFIYQYAMFGGYVRGGQFVDFLVVTTVPQSTFVQVFGDYWHSGELGGEDQFNLARLENEGLEVVVLWGQDLPDADTTYTKVRNEIGPA